MWKCGAAERQDYASDRLASYYFFGAAEHDDQYGKDFAKRP